MIDFENISKEYSIGKNVVKALDNVSFHIKKGEFTVILGPSGSGKSTLLNLIGGMDSQTAGKITVDNNIISDLGENKLVEYRRKDIGFVFQFYNLIPNLTVYENVAIAKKLGKDTFNVNEMLEAVGLFDRKDHFPQELSGGEMQRVSIARALCKNPKLLLCDEPTGALDSRTGDKVMKLLKKMSDTYHKNVIMVTHNELLSQMADRAICLKDGSIISDIIQNDK